MNYIKCSVLFGTIWVSATGISFADQACDDLVAGLPKVQLSMGREFTASTQSGKSYKQLFDDCDATDNFAGQTLPSGNKCSSDKNSVEFIKTFNGRNSGNTLVFRAKAAVDVDGSPASHLGNPNDQSKTSLFFDKGSVDETANAEEVPFVVIPQNSFHGKKHNFYNTFFGRDLKIKTGDLAVAVHGGKCSFGVVGDTGPEFRLGEASMRAHIELGNPQCDKEHQNEHPCLHVVDHGNGKGIDGPSVTYLIFPQTRPAKLVSQTVLVVAGNAARKKAKAFIMDFAK